MTDDQVNSFAAFQFLRELRERKERERAGEEDQGTETDSRGERKVVFKNPAKRKQKEREGSGDSAAPAAKKEGVLGGGTGAGVIKMTEYVVGEGGRARKKRKQVLGEDKTPETRSSIALSHLEQEDEEED